MELKTILAIGLVVFIVGALIFFYISRKTKRRQKLWFISSIRT